MGQARLLFYRVEDKHAMLLGVHRFVYLRRAAALLEMALCNWALQSVTAAGFLPMTTPDLVRESVLEKCGFQPRADNTQVHNQSKRVQAS